MYNIKEKVQDCDIKELNEENTELYINRKLYKYKSYFTPENEGIYEIQLIIKILMKNCCCLFYGINNLQSLDLSSFNTQNVTNMKYMFYNCNNLKNLYLSSLNTQNVTNMSYMFSDCKNLKNLDLSSFSTQNVTNMSYMFNNCSKLEKLDLSSFNTPKLSNMSYMFYGCSNLQILDLSSFNTKNVIYRYNKGYIFDFCDKLERVIISFEAPIISRYISKDKIIYA